MDATKEIEATRTPEEQRAICLDDLRYGLEHAEKAASELDDAIYHAREALDLNRKARQQILDSLWGLGFSEAEIEALDRPRKR